jgi:hypothetical protein
MCVTASNDSGNFFIVPGVCFCMRSNWPLRQLLAVLRGVNLIVALVLAAILLQLAPALVRGGVSGVRDHIVRVATAGVPQEHWPVAIARMYETLLVLILFCCVLYWAQRFVGRRVTSARSRAHTPSRTGSQSNLAQ